MHPGGCVSQTESLKRAKMLTRMARGPGYAQYVQEVASCCFIVVDLCLASVTPRIALP